MLNFAFKTGTVPRCTQPFCHLCLKELWLPFCLVRRQLSILHAFISSFALLRSGCISPLILNVGTHTAPPAVGLSSPLRCLGARRFRLSRCQNGFDPFLCAVAISTPRGCLNLGTYVPNRLWLVLGGSSSPWVIVRRLYPPPPEPAPPGEGRGGEGWRLPAAGSGRWPIDFLPPAARRPASATFMPL